MGVPRRRTLRRTCASRGTATQKITQVTEAAKAAGTAGSAGREKESSMQRAFECFARACGLRSPQPHVASSSQTPISTHADWLKDASMVTVQRSRPVTGSFMEEAQPSSVGPLDKVRHEFVRNLFFVRLRRRKEGAQRRKERETRCSRERDERCDWERGGSPWTPV